MPVNPGALLAALAALLAAAGPVVFTTGTEPPQKLERVELPPRCAVCPPGRVTCATYPAFTVREVDLGDVGAELLAVAPRRPKRPAPPCSRERPPGEVSLTGAAESWSGYFEGARGRYAFFRSEDRGERGWGFAVYDGATGERLLADVSSGPVRVTGAGDRVGLAFVRLDVASCSPLSGGDACWQRIRAELGVDDPPPDCATPYREANEAAARAACQGDAQANARCVEAELRLRPAFPPFVPPVLSHEVEIPDLASPDVRTRTGLKVLGCRPGG